MVSEKSATIELPANEFESFDIIKSNKPKKLSPFAITFLGSFFLIKSLYIFLFLCFNLSNELFSYSKAPNNIQWINIFFLIKDFDKVFVYATKDALTIEYPTDAVVSIDATEPISNIIKPGNIVKFKSISFKEYEKLRIWNLWASM